MTDTTMDADELELLRLEREADEDAVTDPDDVMEFETANEEDEGAKASGLKMTFRKVKSPSKSSADDAGSAAVAAAGPQSDFVHPDDLVQKNGRVYVKNLKCSQCSFKAVWETELVRHEAKAHGYTIEAVDLKVNRSIILLLLFIIIIIIITIIPLLLLFFLYYFYYCYHSVITVISVKLLL